jgi:hypothetical protein
MSHHVLSILQAHKRAPRNVAGTSPGRRRQWLRRPCRGLRLEACMALTLYDCPPSPGASSSQRRTQSWRLDCHRRAWQLFENEVVYDYRWRQTSHKTIITMNRCLAVLVSSGRLFRCLAKECGSKLLGPDARVRHHETSPVPQDPGGCRFPCRMTSTGMETPCTATRWSKHASTVVGATKGGTGGHPSGLKSKGARQCNR